MGSITRVKVIHRDVLFIFIFACSLHGKTDGARGMAARDPYHNRSENFIPVDSKNCNYSSCLPIGLIGKILCWQSYEYAVCAKKIIRNIACDKDKYEAAKRLWDELELNRESERCGYYLDPSSETGFSFDESRSELKQCYDFYDYHAYDYINNDFKFCGGYFRDLEPKDGVGCGKDEHCGRVRCVLATGCGVMKDMFCRRYAGREALKWYRICQERGDFERCQFGIDPRNDLPVPGLKNKHHMRCYNLSNSMGAAFSVNGQQSALQKGNSWVVLVAVLINTSYSSG
ncbi:uncharacterized protein LOC131953753 [Physella acuta]|uniref:uncharacterized protein LOC131953753 n=1 Tax=Physella acuta TaxID=109671 RepID=UPI0027DC3B46|nr:uncharacterized protein LOC131953753 [Physella acuta]